MKTRPGLVILWFITILAPSLGADAARAQGHQSGPKDWAAQAPASADVIFVVRDATALRTTLPGRALHDLLSRAGLLAETRASWDALAKVLGWAREESFDKLLGGQFMIVVSGVPETPGAGEPVRWALVSRVNEATDRRLLEKLAAAPRGIVAGHQLLSVEHGAYELAVHRPRRGGDARVIVLGPRERPEMFDRVLRALSDVPRAGEVPIFSTAAAASLAQIGDASAIVLVRMETSEPAKAGGNDPWAAHAALALSADEAGLGLRCVVSDPTAAKLLDAGCGGPPINLDAAFPGALVVMSERPATKASLEPGSPLATVLAAVRMPEPLQKALASGQMVVVQACPAAPGVAVGVAVRLSDPAAAAADADAFMAGLARLIEGEPRRAGAAPAMDFGGIQPRAVRTLPIAAWAALPWLQWPEMWVSWAYTIRDGEGAPEPGWWVMGAAGGSPGEAGAGPAMAGEVIAQLRAAIPADKPGRVLSQAVIRPAALSRAIWPEVPDVGNWREVLGRVEAVRWRFDATGDGRIEGTLRVDLAPAPGAPGSKAR